MADSVERQRDVTRLLLRVVDDAGFALAGSGVIREHGVSARPTEDVDLFATNVDAQRFDQAIDQAVATLHEHGYRVVEHRRAEQYVRLNVTAPDGHQLEVDFGIDWRAHEPVRLGVRRWASRSRCPGGAWSRHILSGRRTSMGDQFR